MLNIRFSNRFETLRDALTLGVGETSSSVFDAPQIVVPSSAVRRALSLAIADRQGICANVEFVYLAAWLWRQIGRVVESVEDASPFASRVLTWQIYDLLGDRSWTAAFERLGTYLESADPVRRWDLASSVAVVLEQYITYRQDWLTAWSRGERIDLKSASTFGSLDQDWQAELWRRLLTRMGSEREHPAARFFKVLTAAGAGARSAELPPTVHVFCLPAIPPLYLDVLLGLGQWIDVELYVLNPCREYWFDILDAKRLSRLIVRGAATHRETGNRLLASWGNQTRGQIELLLDRSGDAPIDDSGYDDDYPATVLGALQRSVLELTELVPGSLQIQPDDRSLEVHVCHSLTRELEVLQDQLLALLSGPAPPSLADILVVTPDLDAAAPLIDAVFGTAPAERYLAYQVSGRGRSTVNAPARALLSLLAILASRFAASALIELLQQPIIGRCFGMGSEELVRIEDWLEDSGIRWGIDADHRSELGLPHEGRFTLTDGLHRLFLGYALPQRTAAPVHQRVPAGNPEGSSALDLGRFTRFCELLTALRSDFRRARSADDWLAALTGVLETFMLPVGDELDDLGEVRDAIRELHADMRRGGGALEVPLTVLSKALDAVLGVSAHGGVPTGAITFTFMTSLRNLPFAVICVVGLNDGAFPQISRATEFDLMAENPRRGDRQRRTDDRNLFLDLMLAARQRFYLSYTGRSVFDNSILPASVVVAELIETLLPAIAHAPGDPQSLAQARRRLVVEHPLQAFSRLYFTAGGDPRMFSFNRELRAALAGDGALKTDPYALAPPWSASEDDFEGDDENAGLPVPFFTAPLSPAGDEWRSVSLSQLQRFFRNPCHYLLRERLRIALYREESSQSDDEPFVADHAARAALAERLLPHAMLGSSDMELVQLAQAGVEYPLGAMGAVLLQEELLTLRQYADAVRSATSPMCLAPFDVAQSFGLDGESWHLSTVLNGLRPEGLVLHRYDDTRPTDYLQGWLAHLLLCVAAPAGVNARTRFISRNGGYVLEDCKDAAIILRGLLLLYRKGLHEPLHFFPRSAWAYHKSAGNLNDAQKEWRQEYGRYPGEGQKPAYRLAFRARPEPIDQDFVDCVEAVFGKLPTYLHDESVEDSS